MRHALVLSLAGALALSAGCAVNHGTSISMAPDSPTPNLSAAQPVEIDGISPAAIDQADRASKYDMAVRGLIFENDRVRPNEKFALARDPNESKAREAAGAAAMETGYREIAILEYAAAVRLDSQSAGALVGLGRALETKGKTAEAGAAYATALDLTPDSCDTRYALAMTYWKRDRMGEAEAQLLKALATDPNYGPAHERLAVAAYYRGDLESARLHADAAQRAGTTVPAQLVEMIKR